MGYPLPLPERVSVLRTAVLGQVVGAVQQLDEYLHRWALRMQLEVVPRYNWVGSIGQPVTSRTTARRWDAIVYDPSGGAFTLDVPPPSYATLGDEILLIRSSTSGAILTLQTQGALIDGSATALLTTPRGVQRLRDCGDQWKLDPAASASAVPVGSVLAYPDATIPSGWLHCNGQTVSRTTYAALNAIAAAAGYASPWGPGNGSTTFEIPDYRGRMLFGAQTIVGWEAGSANASLSVANLPAHTHTYTTKSTTLVVNSGAGFSNIWVGTGSANSGSTGSGASFSVMNPYSTVNWIIYAG